MEETKDWKKKNSKVSGAVRKIYREASPEEKKGIYGGIARKWSVERIGFKIGLKERGS